MITGFKLLQLAAFSFSLATGQILFKLAANKIAERTGSIVSIFDYLSWPLFVALCFYGLTTILWVWVLVDTPLARAYPFSFIASALVPIAAWILFKEDISWTYVPGFALIIVGLYLCVR